MEKFTKSVKNNININNNNIIYEQDYIKIKKINENIFVEEADRIVALPYIKDEGYVYLRGEIIPAWTDKYKGKQLRNNIDFLTVISGTIENGETPAQTLRRELYEEAGLSMSQFYKFEIDGPYFESKGNTSQFYICLMELNYTDYKLGAPIGDGTKLEKLSKTLRVSIADLDEIRINDMATKILIDKLKYTQGI